MSPCIWIEPENEQRLDHFDTHTGRSKTYYVHEIIERGLEKMEDYYLAADVLERMRKGEKAVHSTADVKRDLGLEE